MAKIVGRNATAYYWQVIGFDNNGNPVTGASTGMLGRWKTVEFTHKNNWTDSPTSSDATEPERLKTTSEWSATLKGLMDQFGSEALESAYSSDYIQVGFTVTRSGGSWRYIITGGIDEASGTFEQDAATDDLKIISVGGAPVIGVASWQMFAL